MIVGVQGTSSFNNYNIFLRSMAVALSELLEEDKEFYIYSAGPENINMMAMEFSNLSEKGMKLRGKSIKFIKVNQQWLEENVLDLNHGLDARLAKRRQSLSQLKKLASFDVRPSEISRP